MEEVTIQEYMKLIEMQGRVKAFKDYLKEEKYASSISKDVCIAILGLNLEEETEWVAKT